MGTLSIAFVFSQLDLTLKYVVRYAAAALAQNPEKSAHEQSNGR